MQMQWDDSKIAELAKRHLARGSPQQVRVLKDAMQRFDALQQDAEAERAGTNRGFYFAFCKELNDLSCGSSSGFMLSELASPSLSTGRRKSSLVESGQSMVKNLQKLRDANGLDTPTIVRHGSQIFSESHASPLYRDASVHKTEMTKTSSVPELKSIGSSKLGARRLSKRRPSMVGWRDNVPDIKALMKVDDRMTGNELQKKVFREVVEEPNSPVERDQAAVLRHQKSYRFKVKGEAEFSPKTPKAYF